MNNREVFYRHLAQTSPAPLALEIEKAEGVYLYDINGTKYLDLISGISVSNIGHCNPDVIEAVHNQAQKYMHLMVYGEFIQSPQTKLAELLVKILPQNLNSIYFLNSGSEAVEGALKLAKRFTHRSEIICFKNAYHGSTHGSLSVMGNESFKNAFRPLLPDVKILEFNNLNSIELISYKTACVIIETIQGEAGIIVPSINFIKLLRDKCSEVGALLIFDEIQTGFGRTGKFFAFEHYQVFPDILTIAKGMGGGMPIGAFISSSEIMNKITYNPVLGHITTFGGHPVCCAAAIANINFILKKNLVENAEIIGKYFINNIKHPSIKNIRGKGLFIAIEFESADFCQQVIKKALEKNIITDWFLFADNCLRLAPPLIINIEQAKFAIKVLLDSIEVVSQIKKGS